MDSNNRCHRCGAPVRSGTPAGELLSLEEIMQRYKIGRTKALELRRELRKRSPDAVKSHARVIRVEAIALERLWSAK